VFSYETDYQKLSTEKYFAKKYSNVNGTKKRTICLFYILSNLLINNKLLIITATYKKH